MANKAKSYEVNRANIIRPIHTNLNGKPVAVGTKNGEVVIKRTPPALKLVIPEATPSQLKELVEKRIINPKYVKEVTPKVSKPKPSKKALLKDESKAT